MTAIAPGGSGEPPLPCDRGEDEKDTASGPEKQAYDPKPGSFCKRGDCRDGNRDLEHGHPARENFVLVKVCFRRGFLVLGFRFDLLLLFLVAIAF